MNSVASQRRMHWGKDFKKQIQEGRRDRIHVKRLVEMSIGKKGENILGTTKTGLHSKDPNF